jgi:regulator of cell morphogenesis and NO signaling
METLKPNTDLDFSKTKIRDLVIENFHTAELFEKLGIDFCCNGNRLLEVALQEKEITKSAFLAEFETINDINPNAEFRYTEWGLDFLILFIIDNHHNYVKKAIPSITAHLQKIQNAHGDKYAFISEVENNFAKIARELTSHMDKEEKMLFPLIKYLVDSKKLKEKPKTRGYGSVQNPIKQMESEHTSAGNLLENIRNLTNNYTLPEDSCATFEVTYSELEEFEKDLHKHIHLENNILFPRAIELEENLLQGKYD